jgi:hypothetical protein
LRAVAPARDDLVNPDRRRFLRRGLVGGALLVVAGAAPFAFRTTRLRQPRDALRVLSAAEYSVLAAVVARIVPGDGAGPPWPSADALDCAGKIDALMARVHPSVGHDFRRLLRLIESGLGGALLAASPRPFTRAAPVEQDARLEAWRGSRLALLRSGYQAVKRLAHATYYASPETYTLIGYPGPPGVPQPPETP